MKDPHRVPRRTGMSRAGEDGRRRPRVERCGEPSLVVLALNRPVRDEFVRRESSGNDSDRFFAISLRSTMRKMWIVHATVSKSNKMR